MIALPRPEFGSLRQLHVQPQVQFLHHRTVVLLMKPQPLLCCQAPLAGFGFMATMANERLQLVRHIPSLRGVSSLSRSGWSSHNLSGPPVSYLMAALAVFYLATAPRCALAQVARGNINGVVVDSSGARVPGAAVAITESQTALTRTLTTNEAGEFNAPLLSVGTYSISVEQQGFKRKVVTGITLLVDQTAAVRVVLEPGEVRQSIEVTGQAPLLQPSTGSLGQVIENKYIVDLPLNGRNPYALGLLSGNVAPTTGGPTNQPFVAGGARFTSNSFLVDGVGNTTFLRNIGYVPSVDAVQEYKVQTSSYSAEFGDAAGAVVNLVTKSGTNEFHGGVYEYVRNEKLDANSFFNNASGIKRPPFHRNQFGFAVGGPVKLPKVYNGRDKTFFFFNYEGFRQRQSSFSGLADLPPMSFRRGDFSNYRDASGKLIPVFDPTTRKIGPGGTVTATQFPANIIPPGQINPVTAKILELLPEPDFGGPDAVARNFLRTAPRKNDSDNYDFRVDHSLSSANSLFFRGSVQNTSLSNPSILPAPLGGSTSVSDPRSGVINFTHIFSPSTVDVFQFSAARVNIATIGASEGVATPGLARFPFPVQGLPEFAFNFSGNRSGPQQFNSFGGAGSTSSIENTFQWTDNITTVRGKHTLKAGLDIHRFQNNFIGGDVLLGRMIFGSIWTSSPDAPGSGAPFADFLLGLPTTIEGSQFLDWGELRQVYNGEYFQDDWKATPRLALNLGVRYDLWSVPVDARDKGGFLDVSRGRIALPGKDGFSRGIVDGDHNSFAPRFGFAYQFHPRIVARGSYGIFFAQQEKNPTSQRLAENPPNTPVFAIPPVDPSRDQAPKFDVSTPIQNVPFDPTLRNFSVSNPISRTFFTADFRNQEAQYLQQFQMSVQYEPWANWLFEISYSGSLGRKLGSRINLNQLPESSALNGTNTQANRFLPILNGILVYDGAFGTSNYNAMNLKVERRYSNGLELIANYTYSRYLELGPTGVVGVFDQAGGTSLPLDSFNMRREYGPSVLDLTHYFVTSSVYELPFGPRKRFLNFTGPLGKLAGGCRSTGSSPGTADSRQIFALEKTYLIFQRTTFPIGCRGKACWSAVPLSTSSLTPPLSRQRPLGQTFSESRSNFTATRLSELPVGQGPSTSTSRSLRTPH